MPRSISKSVLTASFTYGPEHQRTRQTRSDGSIIVYAGAQEIEISNGRTIVKTYWPNGIGVEIDRASGPTEMSWTHVDRLESLIALTAEDGTIREKMEYDPWGKRRSTIDNVSTPDNIDGSVQNRGFTGHEMLDNLDLVHMNGRIYNPTISKFFSPDSFVADATDGQSFNRYSYVSNNPTNVIDPSGFIPEAVTGTLIRGGSVGGANVTCIGNCGSAFIDLSAPLDVSQTAGSVGGSAATRNGGANNSKNAGGGNSSGEGEKSLGTVLRERLIDPLKEDVIVKSVTNVYVTGKKIGSDIVNWATGDSVAREAAKLDLWTNRFQYANSVMIMGALRRGGATKKLARYQGFKSAYAINPAHIPGKLGNNPGKTKIPADAESVYS